MYVYLVGILCHFSDCVLFSNLVVADAHFWFVSFSGTYSLMLTSIYMQPPVNKDCDSLPFYIFFSIISSFLVK